MAEIKKQNKISKIVLVVLALVVGFTSGFLTHYYTQSESIKKLSEILNIIENKAKHPAGNDYNLDADSIAKEFVNTLLVGDAYANYYTEEEYNDILTQGAGNHSGIGINFYYEDCALHSVIGNSPAEHAGLKAGDCIVKARIVGDVEYIEFERGEQLVEFIDPIESDVSIELVIRRAGEFEEKSFFVAKKPYVRSYVYYYDNETAIKFYSEGENTPQIKHYPEEKNDKLPSDTAHIVFSLFEGDSAKQLAEVLEYFYSKGKTKLILDLRDNGGGYLTCLGEVASHFIYNNGTKKSLITKVEEKNSSFSYYTAENNFNTQLEKIVVLANEGTASASECLIGAMLCYEDAGFSKASLLIEYNEQRGDYSTYGKGIMQSTYKLSSGGALKLTMARIYWPDEETCIQDVGIVQTDPLNFITKQNAISRAVEILS